MPYGDPESCRLEIRHADGKVDVRAWQTEEWGWPPHLGQLIHDEERSYRIASIAQDGGTVVVVLPTGHGVRRLPT